MVLATDSNSQRGDRRMSFRMLGAQWRNSWRNSDRTLESRDGGCTKRSDALVDETPRKSVHFPDEIVDRVIELPQIEFTTTFDEVEERWYDVSFSRTEYLRNSNTGFVDLTLLCLSFLSLLRLMTIEVLKRTES